MIDAVIIGSGPGGYTAAVRIAQLGGKAAVIEKKEVGGTCTNWGCIPTKALQASAKAVDVIKKSKNYGLTVEGFSVDFNAVMQRKDRVVRASSLGIKKLLESHNVNLITGTAEILSANEVLVRETGEKLIAKNIIIATGSSPFKIPNIEGITSDDILKLDSVPSSLLIIGGGPIGVEFATIFSRFGAEVTIVEMMERLIPLEDPEIAAELTKILERNGIKIFTGAAVEKSDGKKAVIKTKEGVIEKEFDTVLVAIGRRPNINNEELDRIGVEYEKKGVKVNKKLQTNINNIYAIGDVTGIMPLAHVASEQGIVAAENIMGQTSEVEYGVVPSCIFTLPEIASVGLKEGDLGKFPMIASGKGRASGATEGFVKVFSKEGKLVGAHIIGDSAPELIAEAALAVNLGIKVEDIARTIHAHPTLAEAFLEAVKDTSNKAINLPKK